MEDVWDDQDSPLNLWYGSDFQSVFEVEKARAEWQFGTVHFRNWGVRGNTQNLCWKWVSEKYTRSSSACMWFEIPLKFTVSKWNPFEHLWRDAEGGCPPMLSIQPGRPGEDLRGLMAKDPQIQGYKMCWIIPKKTHGCNGSKRCFCSILSKRA